MVVSALIMPQMLGHISTLYTLSQITVLSLLYINVMLFEYYCFHFGVFLTFLSLLV